MSIKRGDVFMADLSPVVGSEQGGIRPVLVLQNDVGNQHSQTTIVAAITTQKKAHLPTHVAVKLRGRPSTVLLEQVRTVSRSRLMQYMDHLSEEDMKSVEDALKVSFSMSGEEKTMPAWGAWKSFCTKKPCP